MNRSLAESMHHADCNSLPGRGSRLGAGSGVAVGVHPGTILLAVEHAQNTLIRAKPRLQV